MELTEIEICQGLGNDRWRTVSCLGYLYYKLGLLGFIALRWMSLAFMICH